MDKETVNYIMGYFSHLWTKNEALANRYQMFLEKRLGRSFFPFGFEQAVLDLCANGYDAFAEAVANRIMTEQADKVFLNKCPKCEKLARTPYAKQCRHCAHSWREAETK